MRGRQREQRGLGVLLALHGVTNRAEDGLTGWAERRRDERCRYGGHRKRTPISSARSRNALVERVPDDLPAALAGVTFARCGVPPRHRTSSSTRPASSSSPRRSLELTVPRGRPSSSEISLGVYSSKCRRTITARCSGESSASPSASVREWGLSG